MSHEQAEPSSKSESEAPGRATIGDSAATAAVARYQVALQASEARFRKIIERNIDTVLVISREGVILFANPAAETLLGVRRSDLIGRPIGVPIIPGENTEVDLVPRHSPARSAEMRVVEIEWETELAYLASLRDVTERKRTEDQQRMLAETGAALAGTLDTPTALTALARLALAHLADCCLIDLLEDGETVRRYALARQAPDSASAVRESVGRWPQADETAEGLPRVLRTAKAELYGDAPACVVASLAIEPGTPEPALPAPCRSLLIVPLVANGRTLGAVTLVSARRRYDQADLILGEELARRTALVIENARLYTECQRAVRCRDEFLAMLSHELRNPLGVIANALMLMQACKGDLTLIEHARTVACRQIDLLTRLVDDLLDVSRITRGKIQLRLERVELATIVARAVEAAQPTVDHHRHRLSVSLPAYPLWLEADATRLTQVLSNLLQNATKYTEPGGSIHLSVERIGDEAFVRIRDTGVGIARDLLERIFEPFTQADRSLDRSLGGLGLGLALVRSLVELHGGTVRACSEGPGKGSEFVVRLPVQAPPEDGAHGPTAAPRGATARARRILIVDDNADAADSLRWLLELTGHAVWTAHNGHAALEAAAVLSPELVLLDIGLPGLNGYEVARHLRSQPAGRDMVLVALTGYGQDEDRRRAHEAGFDHHFVKPLNIEQLQSVLQKT